MLVPERDIVPVMVLFVKVNIPNVIALLIMFGMEVLVYVVVISNIVVAVRDIVRGVVHLVAESIRVATVPHIIVGMAVLVFIRIVTLVRVDIQLRVRE